MIAHWDEERLARLKAEVDAHLEDYMDVFGNGPRGKKLIALAMRRVPAFRPCVVNDVYRLLVGGLMQQAIADAQHASR